MILSSATVSENDLERLKGLRTPTSAGQGPNEPEPRKLVEISLNNSIETAKSITLRYCLMPALLKDAYLLYLLEKYKGNDILVFFNKCE